MIQPDELKQDTALIWSTGNGTDVWEMFCAAGNGDIKTVKALLEKDASLVRSAYEYHTPMFFAVCSNQLEVAMYLLEKGASPVVSGTSDNLLQIARDRGYHEMALLIEKCIAGALGIEAGSVIAEAIKAIDIETVLAMVDANPALISARDEAGNQPIHWAVMSRQPALVDEFLLRGADINAARIDGARPVQLCNGDYTYRGWRDVPVTITTTPAEMFAHLKSRGAYIDLCTACNTGDFERVKELLQEDPSRANRVSDYVTYYQGSGAPLKNAAARGYIDIVKLLLQYGADPNLPEEGIAPYGHALYAAVTGGYIEIVRLLLKHGAHANPPVESSADALSIAISHKNQEMIELLCSHGASRKVHLLAYYGDVQTAAAVFDANPALANNPHALECAAGEGQEAFVKLMLRYVPDLAKRISAGVNSQGPDASVKTRQLAELLFKHGMNPNFENWLRITPLHRFAQRGDVENAAIFIDHGSDLNVRDEEICSTPLGWAAKFGKINMVKLLLERGAKPDYPGGPEWAQPLVWAERRGHEEIALLLREYSG